MKDVVAKDKANRVVADELPADDKRLGNAIWCCLLFVAKGHAQVAAIAQQTLEQW
jgi:hypothetical protein